MKNTTTVIYLVISALLLLTIGSAILLAPHAFHGGNGIILGDDPNLLSEVRAPGGLLAASGVVDEQRLESMLEHPYFNQPYPKSLDRFDFNAAAADDLSAANGAALLTAFTAAAVGKGLDQLPNA